MKVDEQLINVSLNNDSDIKKIDSIIEKYDPQVIEISGCPGTGKTTLVKKLKGKYKDKYVDYFDIREEHFKIFDKNISILPSYLLFVLKNIPLHYTIFKSLKKNKLENLKTFSYYIFQFEFELKKVNGKFIIRDEPLFQLFFVRKYHHKNDVGDMRTLIKMLNKKYYKNIKVINIHLIEDNVENILKKRINRNRINVDNNKSKKCLKKEVLSYKENIYNYRFRIRYNLFVNIELD